MDDAGNESAPVQVKASEWIARNEMLPGHADAADLVGALLFRSGSALVLLETPGGIVLLTREQLRDRVRAELADVDLVGGLLEDRRVADAAGDRR